MEYVGRLDVSVEDTLSEKIFHSLYDCFHDTDSGSLLYFAFFEHEGGEVAPGAVLADDITGVIGSVDVIALEDVGMVEVLEDSYLVIE